MKVIMKAIWNIIFGCGCYVGGDAIAGNIICEEHRAAIAKAQGDI